jgi:serine/threonine protein kinase
MIISDYYESDLTHYITNNFYSIRWYDKLRILRDIISGLNNIHNANIIHKDFHSGNILINGWTVVTSDLGISKSALDDDNDNEIYGVIPYIAPEIFQGQKYTKSSEIYSFGMIMWELMTGRRPFWDHDHDAELIIKISDGFRPPIFTNAPKGYVELMQECWHSDPKKRPTASYLESKISSFHGEERKYETKIIKSPYIGPITTDNSNAIYKSRPLSTMIQSAELTRASKYFYNGLPFFENDETLYDDFIKNNDKGTIQVFCLID